ncbi:MAG: TetR/AcrR family transcriptional regulator [Planctomycetota bacterium]
MTRISKRETIMQAAEKLFTSRRFHEITLDDIVQEAHVGKGTIYTYFKDKEDLFFQVATSGFDELCDVLRRRVPGSAPFAEQLLHVCESISAFFRHRRPLFRMIQAEDARMSCCRGRIRERWMEKRTQLVAVVTEIIQKGLDEGKIRRDVPPDVLACFLLGMLRTQTRDLAEAPEAVRRHELLVDLFLHGAGRTVEGTEGAKSDPGLEA